MIERPYVIQKTPRLNRSKTLDEVSNTVMIVGYAYAMVFATSEGEDLRWSLLGHAQFEKPAVVDVHGSRVLAIASWMRKRENERKLERHKRRVAELTQS